MVGWFIEPRDIDSFNPGRAFQKLKPAVPFPAAALVGIQELVVDRLPFPDIKQVEKLRQRLRIVGAGPSADDDGVLPGAVCAVQGDLA
jgi:hypothetical protein